MDFSANDSQRTVYSLNRGWFAKNFAQTSFLKRSAALKESTSIFESFLFLENESKFRETAILVNVNLRDNRRLKGKYIGYLKGTLVLSGDEGHYFLIPKPEIIEGVNHEYLQ